MELMEAIYGRRSVRDYLSEPVPKETIKHLIDAAIQAPSAMNEQPWSFVIIEDQSLLDRMSEAAKIHMVRERGVAALPAHLYERLADANFHLFYHAPVLVVISAVAQGPWIVEDCALAAENLMLAAFDAELGSCWIGLAHSWLNTTIGKETIGVPDAHVPVAPIIIGRPKTPAPLVSRKVPETRWIS
jgi:nitroreductase